MSAEADKPFEPCGIIEGKGADCSLSETSQLNTVECAWTLWNNNKGAFDNLNQYRLSSICPFSFKGSRANKQELADNNKQ